MIAAVAAAAVLAAAPGVTATQVVLAAADGSAARGADAYLRYVDDRGGIEGRTLTLAVDALPEDALAALGAAPVEGLPVVGDVGPSAAGEAEAYGRYLAANLPAARIAVLYDAADDALAGLRRGLGAKRASVAAALAYDPATTDVFAALTELQASGATVLCVLAAADDVLATLPQLPWKPQLLVRGATARPPVGTVTGATVKDPVAAPSDDPGIVLYRRLLARYAKGADWRDPGYLAGMASAFAAVDALRRAGRAPTRASLAKAVAALHEANNPFLLPGVRLRPSSGVAQVQLRRFAHGRWQAFGGVVSVRA